MSIVDSEEDTLEQPLPDFYREVESVATGDASDPGLSTIEQIKTLKAELRHLRQRLLREERGKSVLTASYDPELDDSWRARRSRNRYPGLTRGIAIPQTSPVAKGGGEQI